MKAAIINVTGYAGVELARILHRHPSVNLTCVTGRSAAGQRLGDFFPHLSDIDLTIEADLNGSVDLVFSALPHKASAEACAPLLKQGIRVVDISADFRINSAAEYEAWYGVTHPCPEYLEEAVYGLTELTRSQVRSASLVANPGCYPTGAILALAPAVKYGIIEPDIIVDSKSGVSGAGRGLSLLTHFSEVNESVQAYSVDGHRHLPEITQELGKLSKGFEPSITFLPHLIPMTRGILSSCYASIKAGAIPLNDKGKKELTDLYREFYKGETFVKVVSVPPMTKHTLGNNDCIVFPTLDVRTGRLMAISCLDNLVKGAAGQAIQNMNVMFGLPEDEGLTQLALYP
ncbi:MAG: N-acetyl-gamma-glutamyl-phosphate reductase [Chloroflexi bacterium]|nr:N-acetyl-gamma-glutamyl-phosphate reductase [Chloroflexota bacterium]